MINNGALRLMPDIVSLSACSTLDEVQQASLIALRVKALSDPSRLRILRVLAAAAEQTVSVGRLTELLNTVEQSMISRHIRLLVHAGFLELTVSRIKGKVEHFYHVKLFAIRAALGELLSYIGIVQAEIG